MNEIDRYTLYYMFHKIDDLLHTRIHSRIICLFTKFVNYFWGIKDF